MYSNQPASTFMVRDDSGITMESWPLGTRHHGENMPNKRASEDALEERATKRPHLQPLPVRPKFVLPCLAELDQALKQRLLPSTSALDPPDIEPTTLPPKLLTPIHQAPTQQCTGDECALAPQAPYRTLGVQYHYDQLELRRLDHSFDRDLPDIRRRVNLEEHHSRQQQEELYGIGLRPRSQEETRTPRTPATLMAWSPLQMQRDGLDRLAERHCQLLQELEKEVD